jgi:uncharacterized protein
VRIEWNWRHWREPCSTRANNAVLWDSKSRQISYGPKEIEQVRKIVGFVRKDPHVAMNEVFVIGFSLGAAIAIGAASADTDHQISGIVADSPYANLKDVASRYVTVFGAIPAAVAWPARTVTFATAKAMHGIDFDGRNPADWAHRITCPVFLIHGKSDKTIPFEHSEQIFQRLNIYKELWLVEGTGHTEAFFPLTGGVRTLGGRFSQWNPCERTRSSIPQAVTSYRRC